LKSFEFSRHIIIKYRRLFMSSVFNLKDYPMMRKSMKLTLDEFFPIWIAEKSVSVRTSTLYRNNSLYKNHISPVLGRFKLEDIKRQDVIALQAYIYRNLASSSTNAVISMLYSVMKAAVQNEVILKNPCVGVSHVRAKEYEQPARDTIHRALTIDETRIFLKHAEGYWYYPLFIFLFNTGCRCGEASALRWSDVDTEKNVIHIRRTVTRGKDGLIEGKPKTGKSRRDIPMNEAVLQVLEERKKCRKAEDDHVFFTTSGKRFTANLINSDLICLLHGIEEKEGVKIPFFSIHATRDTFATRALEAGMAPNTLKEILGHASLAMTMDLYAHVMPNTKQEEMKKVRIGA
jgi:integrase